MGASDGVSLGSFSANACPPWPMPFGVAGSPIVVTTAALDLCRPLMCTPVELPRKPPCGQGQLSSACADHGTAYLCPGSTCSRWQPGATTVNLCCRRAPAQPAPQSKVSLRSRGAAKKSCTFWRARVVGAGRKAPREERCDTCPARWRVRQQALCTTRARSPTLALPQGL